MGSALARVVGSIGGGWMGGSTVGLLRSGGEVGQLPTIAACLIATSGRN